MVIEIRIEDKLLDEQHAKFAQRLSRMARGACIACGASLDSGEFRLDLSWLCERCQEDKACGEQKRGEVPYGRDRDIRVNR